MVDQRIRDFVNAFTKSNITINDVIATDQLGITGETGQLSYRELHKVLETIAIDKTQCVLTKDANDDMVLTTRYSALYGEPVDLSVERQFRTLDYLSVDFQSKTYPSITIDGTSGIPIYGGVNSSVGGGIGFVWNNVQLDRNAIGSGINRWIYYPPDVDFPLGRVYYDTNYYIKSQVYFYAFDLGYIAGFLKLDGSTNSMADFLYSNFPGHQQYLEGNATKDFSGRCLAQVDGTDILPTALNNGKSESFSFTLNHDVLNDNNSFAQENRINQSSPNITLSDTETNKSFILSKLAATVKIPKQNTATLNSGNQLNKPASFGGYFYLKL